MNTDGASNGVVLEDFDGVLTWSLEHSWLLKKCRVRCTNVVIFIIHGYIKKEPKKMNFLIGLDIVQVLSKNCLFQSNRF